MYTLSYVLPVLFCLYVWLTRSNRVLLLDAGVVHSSACSLTMLLNLPQDCACKPLFTGEQLLSSDYFGPDSVQLCSWPMLTSSLLSQHPMSLLAVHDSALNQVADQMVCYDGRTHPTQMRTSTSMLRAWCSLVTCCMSSLKSLLQLDKMAGRRW